MIPEGVPWFHMGDNLTLLGHQVSPEWNGIRRPIARAFFPLRGAARRTLFLVVRPLSADVHRRHIDPGCPANPAPSGTPWGARTPPYLRSQPPSLRHPPPSPAPPHT